ncbi:MAG: polysaccharide biosynthesis tyrosine autokinase [Legionella sp.]|nr:polysaccharide biosynthesis tyrosine autokinase [Legionella sp.]
MISKEQPNYQHEGETDVLGILQTLWEKKWFLLALMFVCLTGAILYTARQVPEFRANLLLQIEEGRNRTKAMLNTATTHLVEGTRRDTPAIQVALMKSRFILEPVVQALQLDVVVRPNQSRLGRWLFPSKAKVKDIVFEVPQEQFGQHFYLKYEKPGFVALYDSHKKRILEGPVGKALASDKGDIQLAVKKVQAPVGSRFLVIKRSEVEVSQQLGAKLKIDDIGVKRSVGIFDISFRDPDGKQAARVLNKIAVVTQEEDAKKKLLEASKLLNFLYQQLPETKKSLEKAELALNQYRVSHDKIDIKLQTQKGLQQLAEVEKQLGQLESDALEMRQRYTAEYPDVKTLRHQITILKQKKGELEARLSALPEHDQMAIDLMREVQVNSELYTTLLNKIQELQVIKAATVSDVRILSYANVPDKPLPSKRSLIYFASLLFGLMLGSLYIFGRKLLFPRVDDPHWIEYQYQTPTLAIIPYAPEQEDSPVLGQRSLLAQNNGRHLAVESIRNLRTSLYVHLSCASAQTLAILGVANGVGKTFIACNLAYLLASTNKRVLLIDTDLRTGMVHKTFGLNAKQGLSEVLQGLVPLESALKPTTHRSLTVLTSGAYPYNPSELLASEQFKNHLKTLAKEFDFVILDTGAISPMTDALSVAAIASVNYLVVGADAHQPMEVDMVMKGLSRANVSIQGTIFNFYNAGNKKTAYYKYYPSKPDLLSRTKPLIENL